MTTKGAEKVEQLKVRPGKITIYLEPWQKRMFKDYFKEIQKIKVITKVVIDFNKPYHLNTYRLPYIDPREGFEIYFSDSQKAYLEEVTGLRVVDSMRVDKMMIESGAIVVG